MPPFGLPIWDAFWQIEKSRQGGYGPQAFTYLEIEAWTRLADEPMRPWEVRAIMAMDVVRRDVLRNAAADEASSEELTAEAYEKIVAGGV